MLSLPSAHAAGNPAAAFRPPAVPLITSDPYLSIWSEADRLTDDTTRHWTHHEHALSSLIRIDDKTYRLMGTEPQEAPALPQTGVRVLPTRSIYDFDNGHVHVTMTFLTPALPDDMEVLTRPLSYITWNVRSVDGAKHTVSLYDSASSQLTVERPEQRIVWGRTAVPGLTALHVGTEAQTLLTPPGDDTRIDWGYAYVAAPKATSRAAIGGNAMLLQSFVQRGAVPAADDTRQPRASNDDHPVLAFSFDLGRIGAAPVERHVTVAYDEIYSIRYFGKKLRPYWRRNGATAADLLRVAERDYTALARRSAAFDQNLMTDLTRAGGAQYAQIAALAYRQALAACGIAADANRQPLFFTKENTSNGDIATVDVFFPMDPMLILFSPTLAKASLVPILSYAASSHWRFPNAPHDLGTYPDARGTDDGGEGMPVEESGNMIILCDAIAQEEHSPEFVARWWPQLTQWAHYLEKYGLDPEDQLCTDDFMGHLAHNANLSVKAILALAAYGDLCKMRGDKVAAARYRAMAKADAKHWITATADGGHSRLAFDKPGTWSQKYNLVWDRILGLNIFPPSVARQEIAYYKSIMQPYGVPLDSRTHGTKTDWSVWSATMAEDPADFRALIAPIYNYLNTTTARQPLADQYTTDDINSVGMHARPVVGGIFIKMLAEPALWRKWSSADKAHVGNWAPLPLRPLVTEYVPTSRRSPVLWSYTTTRPVEGWTHIGFDDSIWAKGRGAFGTPGTPGVTANSKWDTSDIWMRREFTMPAGKVPADLQLLAYHDEDIEVYINGILAGSEGGFTTSYVPIAITRNALAALKPGAKVVLAVHCHQTGGGQGVDVGLATVQER